jgi:hypothetical protein
MHNLKEGQKGKRENEQEGQYGLGVHVGQQIRSLGEPGAFGEVISFLWAPFMDDS